MRGRVAGVHNPFFFSGIRKRVARVRAPLNCRRRHGTGRNQEKDREGGRLLSLKRANERGMRHGSATFFFFSLQSHCTRAHLEIGLSSVSRLAEAEFVSPRLEPVKNTRYKRTSVQVRFSSIHGGLAPRENSDYGADCGSSRRYRKIVRRVCN